MITTTLLLLLLLFLMCREFKRLDQEKHTTHYRSVDEQSGLSLTKRHN